MSEHLHSDECRKIFSLLSEYLDRELPPEARAAIESHLENCGPCIEFAESLRKTVALFHGFSAGEVPPQLSGESRSRLEEAYRKMLANRPG